MKTLKDKIEESAEISAELSAEIADSWMEIADVDGNGTIDFDEIKELVQKLEYTMEDDDLKTIFDEQDTDADGELSKEEFGNAVFSVLKANKSEEAGEEEEEDDQWEHQ